VMNYRLVDTY